MGSSLKAIIVDGCEGWQVHSLTPLFVHVRHVFPSRAALVLLDFRVRFGLQRFQKFVAARLVVRGQVEIVFIDEVCNINLELVFSYLLPQSQLFLPLLRNLARILLFFIHFHFRMEVDLFLRQLVLFN